EPAEALAETAPPVAPPPHLQKVVRRGDTKKNRKQYVVKGAHGLVANLTFICYKSRRICQGKFAGIFHRFHGRGVVLDVGCWMLGVGCWMLDVGGGRCGLVYGGWEMVGEGWGR